MTKRTLAVPAALAAAWILRRFPPETTSWYPLCPFHEATGWLCPGCGGTRAVAALLHGDAATAWHRNGLVTVLLAAGLVYLGVGAWRRERLPIPPWVWAGVGAAAAVFTVLRNVA